MQARIIRDYRTRYANPIKFAQGELVTLGQRDTEWPAFIWTITADGNAGWAPFDWLKPLDDSRAEALRDYSAQELDVKEGDVVSLSEEYGGWFWASLDDGRIGWLPANILESGPRLHPSTATALFILNDLRHAAMDALKAKHKLPALVLLYSFIDICASLANKDEKKQNNLIFKDYLKEFYPSEWQTYTLDDLWAARSSVLHSFSPLGRNTEKIGGATPIYYYEWPEQKEDVEKIVRVSGPALFHLLRITDIKIIATKSFNELWSRIEQDNEFEVIFRKNSSKIMRDLQHMRLQTIFEHVDRMSALRES